MYSKISNIAINSTIEAALASTDFIGKKDAKSADKVATEAMRNYFKKEKFHGMIKIGEGERDEAPMLFIGEMFSDLHEFDIAVDPLEGTNLCAYNKKGSVSVVVISEKDGIIHAPDVYMEKLACLDLENESIISLEEDIVTNIKNYAKFTKKSIHDVKIIMLDRERHSEDIEKIKKLGAQITLIEDGDVSAILETSSDIKENSYDIYYGIGGAPEGVISACPANALKGFFQGRFVFKNQAEIDRAKKLMKTEDVNRIFQSYELITKPSFFAMTGVTNSDLIKGVERNSKKIQTNTLTISDFDAKIENILSVKLI